MNEPDARILGGAAGLNHDELHRHAVRLARTVEHPAPFDFDAFAASFNATRSLGVLISGLPGLHTSG